MIDVLRKYHFHLLAIGAIRLIAGQEAAARYIDKVNTA